MPGKAAAILAATKAYIKQWKKDSIILRSSRDKTNKKALKVYMSLRLSGLFGP